MISIVRAAVLALTVTGSAAYVHITTSTSSPKSAIVTHNMCPRPMCPPSDPNGCGM